jgi:hypothetical protein
VAGGGWVTGATTVLTADPTAAVTGLAALAVVAAAVGVADEGDEVAPVTAETVDVIGPRAEG